VVMLHIHQGVGYLILLLAIVLTIWNLLRASGKVNGKSYRMILVGLMDLQIILGIITWIVTKTSFSGKFILHPISMIIAVAVAHVLTKDSRPTRQRVIGYLLILVLVVGGIGMVQ
jgi:heme A synthase